MRRAAAGLIALFCSLLLEGCNFNVPRHFIGNWEAKVNYLTEFQYLPPGKTNVSAAILNSCNDPNITVAMRCNGHGRCKDWFPSVGGVQQKRLAFCDCDTNWADPECRTPRKSQLTAFILSLFFGVFGVDQFYLGWPLWGTLKLLTLGGGGLWYLFDLCRIGSSPVLTKYNFRVAADLPHFAFVLVVVSAMLFFGFLFSIASIMTHRNKKAHEVLMIRIQAEEEEEPEPDPIKPLHVHVHHQYQPKSRQFGQYQPTVPLIGPAPFTGYGTTLQQSTIVHPPQNVVEHPPVTSTIVHPPVTVAPTASGRSLGGVVVAAGPIVQEPPKIGEAALPVSSSLISTGPITLAPTAGGSIPLPIVAAPVMPTSTAAAVPTTQRLGATP
jgi:TM2 domain-containing membrane protein YozV